jgi:hypothetical protein
MSIKLIIQQGDKFGKLEVISEANKIILPSGQKNRAFKCKCECGNEKIIRLVHLKRGRIASCGCIKNTQNCKSATYLHKVWRAVNRRCGKDYFENHLYYKKGITVCKEWSDTFINFEKWSINNGYKKGLQIDRIDNSKGYSPNNCRWVTSKINNNNRDNTIIVEYNNEKYPISLLLEKLNKKNNYSNILRRIERGWDVKKAIDTPIRKGNYKRN